MGKRYLNLALPLPFTPLPVIAIGQIQPESREQGSTDEATQGPVKESKDSEVDPWGMEVGKQIKQRMQVWQAVLDSGTH